MQTLVNECKVKRIFGSNMPKFTYKTEPVRIDETFFDIEVESGDIIKGKIVEEATPIADLKKLYP